MKIHELTPTTVRDKKRVGRGISAGQGKTAGRGTKGQNSRTGGGVRVGFEGGQNPLAKRLPKKRGFVPINRTRFQVVNIGQLDVFKDGATVDVAALVAAGLVKQAKLPVKLLATGEVAKKLSLQLHAVSTEAKAAIAKAGGTVTVIALTPTPKKPQAKKDKTS